MIAGVLEAEMKWEEATIGDRGEDIRGAKDVINLLITTIVGGRNGGVLVVRFVGIVKVIALGELCPWINAFGIIKAGVCVDHEYIFFVLMAKFLEEGGKVV